MVKATAKNVPKTNKMADTILVILEVKFFMIVFPINPIQGYTTIISHISVLVNTFYHILQGFWENLGFLWE